MSISVPSPRPGLRKAAPLFLIFYFSFLLSLASANLSDSTHEPYTSILAPRGEDAQARVRGTTPKQVAAARAIIKKAQGQAAILNKKRFEHPFTTNSSWVPPTKNRKQNVNSSPPTLYQASEEVARAAALLTEYDAVHKHLSQNLNVTKRDILQKRASSWWMANKVHRGKWPFNTDSTYQVFRDVTDAQWAVNGTARCVANGLTDCTGAIKNAMKAGNRCGAGCNGSTTKQAILYFPPGTYLISSTIEVYFGTQMIGDATNVPNIIASASFVGLGVFSVDHYVEQGGIGPDGKAKEWYVNTANFYRQIRNFNFDLRTAGAVAASSATDGAAALPMCGIHYQVGQATSLTNINFWMSNPAHRGIFAENGSGGQISDLNFQGGGYGIYGGSQQFTAQRITFTSVDVAVFLIWDWGWSWKSISIVGGTTGFKLLSEDGNLHNTGSILILDSVFRGVGSALEVFPVSSEVKTGTTGITLENVLFTSVGKGVVDTDGTVYLPGGTQSIQSWILGPSYDPYTGERTFQNGYATPSISRVDVLLSATNSFGLPLDPYFERTKPQYTDVPWSNFVSVKSAGAKGDGVTDDTRVLQYIITAAAIGNAIVYFDAGTYVITSTIQLPAGTRIVGEAWAQLAAKGAFFSDAANPKPMIQVGKRGADPDSTDVGTVEMQDLLFTTLGATAGAILIEWNLQGSAPGTAGMWDCHTRVGGAIGTGLTSTQCPPSTTGVDSGCTAGSLMMHITKWASVYLENVWLWVADHDIDDPDVASDSNDMTQCSIYVARGLLIESSGPVWLYGTASEHSVLYQYSFAGASNIFATMIQTESPYYQPTPKPPAPFATSLVGYFEGDPSYTGCPGTGYGCDSAWALLITGSDAIYIAGAGLYSWFTSYDQSVCVDASNCQTALIQMTNNGEGVQINNLVTIGATTMIVTDNTNVTSAENLAVDFHPYWSMITSFGFTDFDDDDSEYLPDAPPLSPCTGSYATMEDLEAAISTIPAHCTLQYTVATLQSIYTSALSTYNSLLSNGYDDKFSTYAQAVADSAGSSVSDFTNNNGNKYFSCLVGEFGFCCSQCGQYSCKYCFDGQCTQTCSTLTLLCNKKRSLGRIAGRESGGGPAAQTVPITKGQKISEPCPPDYSQRGYGPDNPYVQSVWWTLPSDKHDTFLADLYTSTGIPPEKITFVDRHNRGNDCAPSAKADDDCWLIGIDYNFPQPNGYGKGDVTNPKDVAQAAFNKAQYLGPTLADAALALQMSAFYENANDLVDAISLPILTIASAVDSMQKVSDAGAEIQAEQRKAIILAFVTAILFFIPIAGEVVGSVTGLAELASFLSLLGTAGNVGLDIYTLVSDPQNAPLAIFSLVLTPLALGDLVALGRAANLRRGMAEGDVAKLGTTISTRLETITKVCGACRKQ
ncbi:hypothetical protein TWF694_001969 [Orbilia ellipsospora]|uniref:Rhamnogalacturonase A/B/Epimerase-like pectate lyase domain-containing protein n=1 Tax=Orbilia ellipsospora TaxID=2528407 RepID=A0AAV9X722_9PEZI